MESVRKSGPGRQKRDEPQDAVSLRALPISPFTVQIERDSPLPRHFQVRCILADQVETGRWQPGDKIPAETDIADALGVSKMTVNKAILGLTAEGVFIREVGRGTFVATGPPAVETFVSARSPHSVRQDDRGETETGWEMPTDVHSAASIVHLITVGPAEKVADNEYLCSLLLAMRCRVSPLEVTLALRQAHGDQYAAYWGEQNSHGWLLIAPRRSDLPGLHALAAMNASAVMVGASWPDVALPSIDSDNRGGVAMAVAHLADRNHRDIALLYADPTACNTLDRIEGFQTALGYNGLPLRPEWQVDAGITTGILEPVAQRLRAWLRQPDRPTAFVAAGPFLACTLLEIAREAGLAVPQDLSIVGFDDPSALMNSTPALTTVQQPLDAMGGEAVNCLHRLLLTPHQELREAEPPLRITLPCRLLVRGSTAPARVR